MEREKLITGYCRALDNSRMVLAEAEDKELIQIDCDYPACAHAPVCKIAQQIEAFLKDE